MENKVLTVIETAKLEVSEKIGEELKILGIELNMYGSKEEPLFLAKDVAEKIGYRSDSINKMLDLVDDEDEKLNGKIFLSGQNRKVWLLTEDGIYSIMMKSQSEKAKEIRKGLRAFLKAWRKGEVKVVPTQTEEDMLIQLFPHSSPELIKMTAEGIRKSKQLTEQVEVATHRIDKANSALQGIECETDRKNLNMLVKMIGAQYCEFHKIPNIGANQSSIYMNIYKHFAKTVGLSFSEIEG
ncbi:MAG: BRO-N domain-containing protein, partial [Cetobacterium sp.]